MRIRNARQAAAAVDELGVLAGQRAQLDARMAEIKAAFRAYSNGRNLRIETDWYSATCTWTHPGRVPSAAVRAALGDDWVKAHTVRSEAFSVAVTSNSVQTKAA